MASIQTKWASHSSILKAQTSWVLTHYPEIAGFAFFAPNASEEILDQLNDFIVSLRLSD